MFPSDLDDEQRAHFAHEHPNDLDSGPSSPSSGTPTFLDPRHRPKSASHHRSRSTTDGSSSSHLLARLVSREEEVREINAALAVTSERLEAESSRANAAERRALDYFHRLRIATENRERAEQESARLREELKLYKVQLENAQKEIFRAQDIIDQVASQRNEAEAEATRARSKARKLQEEKLVMLAREEGRRMGYREGLSMGRRIGFDEELPGEDQGFRELGELSTDEERNDPRPQVRLRSRASLRQHPTRSESAPPVRTPETPILAPPLPIPSRAVPVHVHTPSHGHRTPSPLEELDEPETIHPIPIRPSPIVSPRPIGSPVPDGWIPRADSRTSYIPVPPPHELQQPLPTTPSTVATDLQESRRTPRPEPTPVPPPIRSRDYAYQTPVPPPVPRGHTPSLASRTSTHISQYDLVNKRPPSSLRNEIYVGRARSGSQPSRESTSRNEHRDPERRHSTRTEAESIAEQWRADSESDASTPSPRNPPRSLTPGAVPHPYRSSYNYYRPRESVTPGDDDDPRSRTPVQTEPTAPRPHALPDDFNPARARSPFDYLRQRFRSRPNSVSSGIPDIVVESPSEPETNLSPSAATTTQPELLSPEAANRPLPQDDQHQHQHRPQHQHQYHHQHHHQHHHQQPHSNAHAHAEPHHHRHPSSSHDSAPRSGTPHQTHPHADWPAGFVPYPAEHGTTSTSGSSKPDYRRTRSTPAPVPAPAPTPAHAHAHGHGHPPNSGRHPSENGYVRARTQSASTSLGRDEKGAYEAAPLPPGVTYPAPPDRPHTSHRQYKDRDRDPRDGDRDREGARSRGQDWDRERERTGTRNSERVRFRDRDRDREQDVEDRDLDAGLTQSPAPLQRPISLFDSDEA